MDKASRRHIAAEMFAPHIEDAVKVVVDLLRAADEKVRINAAREIMDRFWGKPVQAIEGSGMGPAILLQLLSGKAKTPEKEPWD